MPELCGVDACHSFKEFGHEGRIGKIQVIGDAGDRFVAVLEVNLDAGDQGIVDPLLGTLAAHAADDSAQVAWRETQPRGVEVDGVVSWGVLADKLNKVGEQLLLAGLPFTATLLVLAPQVIDIPQQGTHQVQCHLTAASLFN